MEQTFGLQPGAMRAARDVLRNYGNMSAATVPFVLEKLMEHRLSDHHLMVALGLGFTAGVQLLEA